MKKAINNMKQENRVYKGETGMSARKFFLGLRFLINHTPSVKNPIKIIISTAVTIFYWAWSWVFVNQGLIPSMIEKGVHDTAPIMLIILYFVINFFLTPFIWIGCIYLFEMYTFLSSDKDMLIENDKCVMKQKEIIVKKPVAKKQPKPVANIRVPKNPSTKEAHYQVPKGKVIPMSYARKMAYIKKVEEYGKEL